LSLANTTVPVSVQRVNQEADEHPHEQTEQGPSIASEQKHSGRRDTAQGHDEISTRNTERSWKTRFFSTKYQHAQANDDEGKKLIRSQ
jgi:hypothetical protein